jgi:hypothetical protein
VAFGLVAAFVAFVFYSLERVEPIKVIGGRIEHEGGRVFVEGALKNTGPDVPAIGLEVNYYDGRGNKLGEDKLDVAGLRHGAEVPFKMPARDLAGASDFSIHLDRGRNPYGN